MLPQKFFLLLLFLSLSLPSFLPSFLPFFLSFFLFIYLNQQISYVLEDCFCLSVSIFFVMNEWINKLTNQLMRESIMLNRSYIASVDLKGLMDEYRTFCDSLKWNLIFASTYIFVHWSEIYWDMSCCPACRTTFIATRFRVAVICPIIPVPHCIRVFFYFVWFVFINHIFQFYYELCTYCNILDIYLS